jgi:hypothetical protein
MVFNFKKQKQAALRECKEMLKFMLRHIRKYGWKLLETNPAVPKGYWRLFGKCSKGIGDLFRNTYRIADTLWERPK